MKKEEFIRIHNWTPCRACGDEIIPGVTAYYHPKEDIWCCNVCFFSFLF